LTAALPSSQQPQRLVLLCRHRHAHRSPVADLVYRCELHASDVDDTAGFSRSRAINVAGAAR
jgi:hypothetical protein